MAIRETWRMIFFPGWPWVSNIAEEMSHLGQWAIESPVIQRQSDPRRGEWGSETRETRGRHEMEDYIRRAAKERAGKEKNTTMNGKLSFDTVSGTRLACKLDMCVIRNSICKCVFIMVPWQDPEYV